MRETPALCALLRVCVCVCAVPGAVVEGLRVKVMCPTSLILLLSPVDAALLGGPENEIEYFVTFTASMAQSRNQTFAYNSSLKVSPHRLLV